MYVCLHLPAYTLTWRFHSDLPEKLTGTSDRAARVERVLFCFSCSAAFLLAHIQFSPNAHQRGILV